MIQKFTQYIQKCFVWSLIFLTKILLNISGFDLWQVKSGTIFDNVLITDDIAEAKRIGDETWGATKDPEKAMKDEQDEVEKKKAEEEAAAAGAGADEDEDLDDEDLDDLDDEEDEPKEEHDEL